MRQSYSLIFFAIFAFFASFTFSAPTQDLVDLKSIPGLNKFTNYTAKVYSGYLHVNENKSHHYIFVESQGNPSKDPLILWLNGGPGCSSILGFLYEHGPFVFLDGEKNLIYNNHSWNKNANMLYMESPACVGYSWCSDAKMPFDDNITASDNLAAYISWMGKFPEFANHPLYVSGESYAGVYVPFLAYYMDQYNEKKPAQKINLVGFMVGNPVTHNEYDTYSDFSFWATHAALSPLQIKDINKRCSPTSFDTKYCEKLFEELNVFLEDVNIYDFYRYCYTNSTSTSREYFQKFKGLYKKHYGYYPTYQPDPNRPPCIDDEGAYLFLNTPTVRKGFHIWDNTSVFSNHTWMMCVDINYTPGEKASYFLYPHLIKKGYRILVFSGDSDGSVPTIGTIGWVEQLQSDLKLKLLKSHTPWVMPGERPNEPQVVGFYRKYQGLDFVIVAGVGHMAPQWQKPASFKMLDAFLKNTDYNS